MNNPATDSSAPDGADRPTAEGLDPVTGLRAGKVPAALTQRSAPEPLRLALHAHLKSVAEKPMTTRTLLELGQAASLASKLLVVSGDPRAATFGPRGGMGGMMGPDYGEVIGPNDLDGLTPISPGGGGFGQIAPLAPAPFGMGENFGAEALRNMIADMQKPKLSDLMRSLEDAEHLFHESRKATDEEGKNYYRKVVTKLRAQIDDLLGADEGKIDAEFEEDSCSDCAANQSEHGTNCPKHSTLQLSVGG